ncbi:MAG: T9SS type A sorting domain-containing protein [Ferruginibacter sp.]
MNIKFLLTTSFLAAALSGNAQQKNIGYAITGDGNKDFIWMNIRQVDLSTGEVVKTIFERSKTNFELTDVLTKKVVTNADSKNTNIFNSADYPTSTFVAAAALDPRGNKLFFTPMLMGELRWLDLNNKGETQKFYTLKAEELKFANGNDEANNITRMVISSDGYGYAVSNDGNNFVRFTTGKIPAVTNLGNLVDADENKGISIHNKCTSWGGDMIADAFGKLYIISANRNVFVIDVNTRIATFKGTITGLPAQYSTNGAAVSNDGDIIVTSANYFEGYYKVKLSDLSATKMEGSDVKYNASDLANGNFLLQKEADEATKFETGNTPVAVFTASDAKVFPNPVTSNSFYVTLDGQKAGKYNVQLTDVTGRAIQTQSAQVSKGKQTVRVNIQSRPVKGIYLVKVINEKNQIVITEKIVIE